MKRFLALICFALLSYAWATVADGDRALAKGDYQTAIDEYQAAYEQRDTNLDALTKLAQAKTYLAETLEGGVAEQLYQEAVDHARAAVAADPELVEGHFELARALGRLAQFRGVLQSISLAGEVQDELERVLELEPDNTSALHALALWHLNVPWAVGGRSGEVRPLFEQAIELEPDAIVHRVDFAEALIELEDEVAAREQLEVALELRTETYQDEQNLAKAQEMLNGL